MRICARIIACESSFTRDVSSFFFFFYDNYFSNVQQNLAQYELAWNSIKSKRTKRDKNAPATCSRKSFAMLWPDYFEGS